MLIIQIENYLLCFGMHIVIYPADDTIIYVVNYILRLSILKYSMNLQNNEKML